MTSIFRRLTDVFRTPPQTGNPYGLTDGEIRALRRLRSFDEYQVLLSALDGLVMLNSEALLASASAYEDSALKNQIIGLRKAGTFVDEVIRRADLKEENERQRSNGSDDRDAARRRLALYGTPFGANRSDIFGA